jgi:RimJ/RimL family protein N-acetyltransferase
MIETATAKNLEDILTGKLVRLWPYQRGAYARDAIYALWRMVENSKAGHKLFWGSHDPDAIHSDLTAFCEFFDPIRNPGRLLLMVQTIETNTLAGLIWFDDIIPKFRAFGSIFILPQYRGEASREAVHVALRFAFEVQEWQSVWGVTPWPEAAKLIEKAGFERLAILPNFALVQGQPKSVFIYVISKEKFSYGLDA